MIRILLTGRDGQVGWECERSLQTLGTVVSVGRRECDLSRADAVRGVIREVAPDLIVNAAAYTAVDRAESEADLAIAVNAVAPGVMAEEARRSGAALIHLSTDYVFDGDKPAPYDEDDAPNPLSVYGRSKLDGELQVRQSGAPAMILRTGWVYADRGRNFVRTVLQLAREREELRIVNDQWGAPTWARSIAEAIATIVARAGRDRESVASAFSRNGGVFHLAASGRTNWYEFAQRFLAQVPDANRKLNRIVPISTAEYPTAASRPANSVLCCDRLAQTWDVRLPRWDEALALAYGSLT